MSYYAKHSDRIILKDGQSNRFTAQHAVVSETKNLNSKILKSRLNVLSFIHFPMISHRCYCPYSCISIKVY